MTAVLTVRVPEPQFEGQTKEILGTPAVRQIVTQRRSPGSSTARFTSPKRDDKNQTALLLDKVVAEMKARISARAHKETQRRKNALESSSLPAKLVDCRSSDVAQSELFIVEGDSALGTAKLARNSEFQALLPIRGKILNVQKASVSDMLSNAECASIIQVIGAGSGRSFDLDAARYGKVILMSDADVDGAHIRTLLLTLFFRYMRPLIEDGRVFAAVPPLHRVIVMNPGTKPNETIYTYSEQELHALLAKVTKSGRRWHEPVQRYKGLGEMDADQLATTTMDRGGRLLRRVRLEDAEGAGRVFELLMGNEVAPRREFIVDSSHRLSREAHRRATRLAVIAWRHGGRAEQARACRSAAQAPDGCRRQRPDPGPVGDDPRGVGRRLRVLRRGGRGPAARLRAGALARRALHDREHRAGVPLVQREQEQRRGHEVAAPQEARRARLPAAAPRRAEAPCSEPGGRAGRVTPATRACARSSRSPRRAAGRRRPASPSRSGSCGPRRPVPTARAGAGPTHARLSRSSPRRNACARTPPVARPFAGNSSKRETLTRPGSVPGSTPSAPEMVTATTSSPVDRPEVHDARLRRHVDARHAAGGGALRPHRRGGEAQQLRIAGHEDELGAVGGGRRAHHARRRASAR